MFWDRFRAYMRVAAFVVALIVAACGNSAGPKAQWSSPASATPPPIVMTPTASPTPTPPPNPTAGSKVTWAVPVHIDDPTSVHGISLVGVSCPSIGLCVAIDNNGNAVTSSNPTGLASDWKVVNVDRG